MGNSNSITPTISCEASDIPVNTTWNQTVTYIPPLISGRVIKVYDGDTITIATKIKEYPQLYRFSIQLKGINAPELNSTQPLVRVDAVASQKALSDLVLHKMVVLSDITESSGKIHAGVTLAPEGEIAKAVNVNRWMVEHKYASQI
jgi:endonuclease YncB( thermonuclease family)